MTPAQPRDEPGKPEVDEASKPTGPVWARLPTERPQRPTRQAIVATAIHLADAEGLDAVSIRRVAAALETRPMGLYSHIARKDDLIDLMADEVLAEALLDEVPADWREALRALAQSLRTAFLNHPWLAITARLRSQAGPNAMRFLEQLLGAIEGLDIDRARKLALARAVFTYAMGYAELAVAREERRASMGEWRTSTQAYIQGLIDSGDFPHIAALGAESLLPDEADEPSFEIGLDWLLTGIAAEVSATSE